MTSASWPKSPLPSGFDRYESDVAVPDCGVGWSGQAVQLGDVYGRPAHGPACGAWSAGQLLVDARLPKGPCSNPTGRYASYRVSDSRCMTVRPVISSTLRHTCIREG